MKETITLKVKVKINYLKDVPDARHRAIRLALKSVLSQSVSGHSSSAHPKSAKLKNKYQNQENLIPKKFS